jgi:hypothetical protein
VVKQAQNTCQPTAWPGLFEGRLHPEQHGTESSTSIGFNPRRRNHLRPATPAIIVPPPMATTGSAGATG